MLVNEYLNIKGLAFINFLNSIPQLYLSNTSFRLEMNSVNPEYWITKYYDDLVNEIDIFTENEICINHSSVNENNSKRLRIGDSRRDYFNCVRANFLSQINTIKNENLEQCRVHSDIIKQKIDGLRNIDTDLEDCITHIKTEMLCKKFCFLIKKTDPNLMYLILTDVFFNAEEIKHLK